MSAFGLAISTSLDGCAKQLKNFARALNTKLEELAPKLCVSLFWIDAWLALGLLSSSKRQHVLRKQIQLSRNAGDLNRQL